MKYTRSRFLVDCAKNTEAMVAAKPFVGFGGYNRVGGYPAFVDRAKDQFIWDVDGNRFIDFLLGFGSVILGHANKSINDEVFKSYERYGANPGLYTPIQLDLANKFTEIVPNADLVTFMKTGSDATNAAIRLARAVTGRSKILRWGMNGWHDWCCDWSPGVLDSSKKQSIQIEYNNLDQVEQVFRYHKDEVACVILMPYDIELPMAGYLEGLRELCNKNKSLLIFDEVRSGFRISLGGAQEYFGVKADLATFGKALGNGFEISALSGKENYMSRLSDVGMTITYYRNPASIVAAKTTLDFLQSNNALEHIYNIGTYLMKEIDCIGIKLGVPIRSIGHPCTPYVTFGLKSKVANNRAIMVFCNKLLNKGILMPPGHHWFICNEMSVEDIKFTIKGIKEVLEDMVDSGVLK